MTDTLENWLYFRAGERDRTTVQPCCECGCDSEHFASIDDEWICEECSDKLSA